jgi:hypothetical protein
MSDKTGGPAFPSDNNVRCGDMVTKGHSGMTLRDYFAEKAMQALIAGSMADGTTFSFKDGSHKTASRASYLISDSMLEAREK